LFQAFNQGGVTLLIATHDLALVESMHKRILTLAQGRLLRDTRAS
jgi:cell division transport system ATP-binding protein